MNFRAQMIDEATLKVVRTAYGVTSQDALANLGSDWKKPGFDANVKRVADGYYCTYVD